MGLLLLDSGEQYKMKFLVLAAFLGCVAAEADPALFYGLGLTYGAGVYGVYGGVHNGLPPCWPCAPVARTYATSYSLPSVYSGYHHGLGYAGLYGGYGLPLINLKTEAADADVDEAMPPGGRKKREAEADPALFYSHSYGVHGARYVPSVYSHTGYGLGYIGYHGLGYTGSHGLPRTYVSGYAGYPYAYGNHGYVIKPVEKAAEDAVEEAYKPGK